MHVRPVARPCRRAGADDQILGADHDRRDRACRADPSRALTVPALAGAVGCDRHPRGGDDPASGLAEGGRLRAADLCRRRLWPVEPRAEPSARARLCRPQSRAARRYRSRWRRSRWRWPRWWTTLRDCRLFTRVVARAERRRQSARRRSTSGSSRPWSRSDRRSAALIFTVYMKTDWGISLFFLVPLALVAIPSLRVRRHGAVPHRGDLARGDARDAGRLAAGSPRVRSERQSQRRGQLWRALGARPRTDGSLAHALSTRDGPWSPGTTEIGEPMTFYSPDHPAPFTPGEVWSSGLTSLEEAKRLGFIGICDTTDGGCRSARPG